MGIQIEDGKGSGLLAAVNDENLLRTLSVTSTLSSHISNHDGDVFTVIGTATVAAGTVVPLFIQNNDPSLLFTIDRIFVQGASITGGTAIPNSAAFFSLGFNRTYSAAGADAVVNNLNRTSAKVANITAKTTNPTLAGTFVESHRWYIQANGVAFELTRPEVDDIILGRSNTLEIRYTSDNTTGTVLALIKFIMIRDAEFA